MRVYPYEWGLIVTFRHFFGFFHVLIIVKTTMLHINKYYVCVIGLEDKAAACTMLVCYARELKEGFADYIEEVVKLMVPMLKFYFHDGIRSAAAESMPYLLECASIKGPAFLVGVWKYMCPELLKAIDTEPEIEVLYELLPSLARCIEILGAGCFDDAAAMTEWLRICDKLLQEHFERASNRRKKHLEEDYDEVSSAIIIIISQKSVCSLS